MRVVEDPEPSSVEYTLVPCATITPKVRIFVSPTHLLACLWGVRGIQRIHIRKQIKGYIDGNLSLGRNQGSWISESKTLFGNRAWGGNTLWMEHKSITWHNAHKRFTLSFTLTANLSTGIFLSGKKHIQICMCSPG